MKIYVNEESQDVRVDFGEEEYARVSVSRSTGKVFTEVFPAGWLPVALGDSEPVYESPAPAYEPPAVPKNGDYVKVTYLNGDMVEGEVRGVSVYKGYNRDGFTGFRVGDFARWAIIPEPGSTYNETEPHNVAATIEVVKQLAKPVEIDGYWVKRRESHGDVAAWSSVECGGLPMTGACSLEEAYENIKASSDVTYMRKYIPALLAVAKFFEQEMEAV